MVGPWKPILDMAAGTLFSRILGLIRDMCLFGTLGTSLYNSAFIFAFTFPNLFRRLWGEGALTSAFVPVMTKKWVEGRVSSFRFLNLFLTRFLIFLCAVCALMMGGLWIAGRNPNMGIQGRLGTQLSVWLMPYMIFICLSAILNATLNVLGDFWVGAFSPLLLNLTMIFSLGLGYICGWSMGKQTWILALSVLLGGILQCGWSAEALRRKQWVPTFMYAEGRNNADLRRLLTLFLPALLGAAVQQINLFVGRFLAFGLNQEAAAILYLANRFMEVPLGIFAAAISTVILPRLSLSVAQKNGEETRKTYDEGMTLMITLLLPAAGGLYFLGEPLLRLFFAWGRFAERDLRATVPALQIFALALPFYGVSSLLVRSFYAQQNTRTPVRVAMSILLVHGVLAITWMGRFQTVGLAWASTLSAMLQTFWLCKILRGQKDFIFGHWPLRLLRWLAATGGMVVGTKISIILLLSTPLPRFLLLLRTAIVVAISMGLYGGGIWFLDRRTARLWRQIFFYRQG